MKFLGCQSWFYRLAFKGIFGWIYFQIKFIKWHTKNTLDSLLSDIRKYEIILKTIPSGNEKLHCFMPTNGVKLIATKLLIQ